MLTNTWVGSYYVGSNGAMVQSSGTTSSGSASSGISANTKVYVSNSGTIHTRSNCSGMKNYTTMTYGEAKAKGYTECKNCF